MLEVRNLRSWYGGAQILRDVAFDVRAQEVVALLGRNGAGKSTTMKSVMGLVDKTAGAIGYDGAALRGRPPHSICRLGVGYVPEDRRVFKDLTVEENLEVGRRPPRADAPAWTVDRLFALFPNLAERRRSLGAQLSGGEQQMLAIARTLMGNPKLVILDEPSEGVAPIIVAQMADVIRELKRDGLSVLLSEQNLHFARSVSDRAYILEKGAIVYAGDFAALDADPSISARHLAV